MPDRSVSRTALITGITGQDGSYLAELLLSRGYRVVGTTRSLRSRRTANISHIITRVELVEDDLLGQESIARLLERAQPDEVYNLAARASSADLFSSPVASGEINALAVNRLLEAIRLVNKDIRFFQALSSEMYGVPDVSPQTESTPFRPTNVYAVTKVYAYWIVRLYREEHGIHASSAILFNHESPRRDPHFVSRKITNAVALIKAKRMRGLRLRSLEARRDWSFAGDFVEAMVFIANHAKADDYVLASGKSHSVRDFCQLAFEHAGMDYRAFVQDDGEAGNVRHSADRVGESAKARSELGWSPRVDFHSLVRMMVDHDLSLVGR